jgi:hypothetical protein
VRGFIRITKPRYDQIHKSICSRNKVFKHLPFSGTPLFFAYPNPELSSCRELYSIIDFDSRISEKENVPVPRKLEPEILEKGTECGPASTLV